MQFKKQMGHKNCKNEITTRHRFKRMTKQLETTNNDIHEHMTDSKTDRGRMRE